MFTTHLSFCLRVARIPANSQKLQANLSLCWYEYQFKIYSPRNALLLNYLLRPPPLRKLPNKSSYIVTRIKNLLSWFFFKCPFKFPLFHFNIKTLHLFLSFFVSLKIINSVYINPFLNLLLPLIQFRLLLKFKSFPTLLIAQSPQLFSAVDQRT